MAMQAGLRAPLFGAVAPWLRRLPGRGFPTLEQLNTFVEPGMTAGGGAPLRFVPSPPASKDFEAQYEVRIYRTGEVATRENNWHDLFNALAWLAFPATKAAINRRHYQSMRAMRAQGAMRGARGTARDALTLFDEGGMIVSSTHAELLELLREFRWKELFCRRRTEVLERMRFFVFGHAIFEKALEPYKGVTAKAVLLEMPPDFVAADIRTQLKALDARASAWFLSPHALTSTRNLSPLPVLGIPGWADNEDPVFYDDEQVFRRGYQERA
jgi:hypothetical protein